MEVVLTENLRRICRLCLRIADSESDLTSIFATVQNPTVSKQKVSYAELVGSISALIVSCCWILNLFIVSD